MANEKRNVQDQATGLITRYARAEPTKDTAMQKLLDQHGDGSQVLMDVVLYEDPECLKFFCRFPADSSSKPIEGATEVTVNCFLWKLVWLPALVPDRNPWWGVSLKAEPGDKFTTLYECQAASSGDAYDQAEKAYPGAELLVAVPIDGPSGGNGLDHADEHLDEVDEDVESLSLSAVLGNIQEVLQGAEGAYIAQIYNQICSDQIVYRGDSMFERQQPE